MTQTRVLRPTRRQAALALSTLAALTVTACSSGDADFEDGDTQPAPQESEPEQPGASDGGGQNPGGTGGDGDGGEVIDAGDAVTTITYTLPTDEINGTMTVGFHHLRARDNTMELLLTYTPEFTGNDAFTLWELHGKDHTNVAPAIFDRENLKRYDILRNGGAWDRETVWTSKQAVHKLAPGDTQAYWANFAVPEDDIETVNIAIPGAPEFEDIPIEGDSSSPSASSATESSTEEGEE